jgi:hypothetical protein
MRAAALLAGLAALAGAVEDDFLPPSRRVSDLRAVAGVSDNWRFLGDRGDRAVRVGAAYFRSIVDHFDGQVTGPLIGFEVSRTSASGDLTDIDVVLITGHAGLAWQTDVPPLHLEAGAFFGAGAARGWVTSDLGGGVDDAGTAFEAGGRLGLFWTTGLGLQLGIETRWSMQRTHADDAAGEPHDADARGFGGLGSVGWRF